MRTPRPAASRFEVPRAAALALLVLGVARCGRDPPAAPAPATVRYLADGSLEHGTLAPASPRSVLVVCLDTVRADALTPWGGSAAPMPRTSAWMQRTGVVFTQATSAASWTGASVASLLTGLLPSHHGAREPSADFSVSLAVPTLAEILVRLGWETTAYAGGVWVSEGNGMLQGFNLARTPFSFGGYGSILLERQRRQKGRGKWLVFLHTYEAHDPYGAPPAMPNAPPLPPPEVDPATFDRDPSVAGDRALVRAFLQRPDLRGPLFETSFGRNERMPRVLRYLEEGVALDPEGPALAKEARAAYDAGLRRLDDALAGFLETADTEGLFEDWVIVVTSDHGEAFGEQGTLHHGRHLHEALVRVPLYVRAPGWPVGRRVDAPCSLLDVVPTVLDLVGLPASEASDGASLAPLLAGGAGHVAVMEERRTAAETRLDVDEDLVGARDGKWSWVLRHDRRTRASHETAFDLSVSPPKPTPLGGGDDPAAWSDALRTAVARLRAQRRRGARVRTGDGGGGARRGRAIPRSVSGATTRRRSRRPSP